MRQQLHGCHAVILGGAGFLGSHLAERLLEAGTRVTVIDNLLTGAADNVGHLVGSEEFRLVKYDVTDFLHVPGEVDYILHFASPASPVDYLRWPIQTLKVGSLGTHKALGLARAKGARILLASTSEVYGDPLVNPQPETYWGNVNPVGPRGVYDEAKRFAEALMLAYHRQHGVDVRIARIFNSVLAGEQVLYDDGHVLRREPVEVAARRLGLRPDHHRAQVAELTGVTVPAFDADGTVRATPASALVAHPTTQRCFEVRTRYGRSIRVTGDHSLFVEGPGGRPEARPVTALTVGDRVALQRRVRVPERDRQTVRLRRSKTGMRVEIDITDELLWLLGLVLAAGTSQGQGSADAPLAISSRDPQLLRRAGKIIERDVGPHGVRAEPAFGARAGALIVHSELLRLVLEHLDVAAADSQRIPGWILGLPLTRLRWFLEGYREGHVARAGKPPATPTHHTFSTTSTALKDDLLVALARFGLLASVERREAPSPPTTEGRRPPHWRVTVTDVSPWSPLEWDADTEQQLDARRTGDLVWAPVEHIDEVEPTPLVYDWSVPGCENFWAGAGLAAKNTYGPRMRVEDGRAVPAFFAAAFRNEPLPVFGDGSQTRSLCYVDDQVDGLLRLLASDHVGPVNIGNPHEVTILELAEAVQDAVGNHPGVVHHPAPEDDPKVRRPDTSLAEQVLGWRARVSLTDGLARTAEWFRDAVPLCGAADEARSEGR